MPGTFRKQPLFSIVRLSPSACPKAQTALGVDSARGGERTSGRAEELVECHHELGQLSAVTAYGNHAAALTQNGNHHELGQRIRRWKAGGYSNSTWAVPAFEAGISRTRSEHHTPGPNSQLVGDRIHRSCDRRRPCAVRTHVKAVGLGAATCGVVE